MRHSPPPGRVENYTDAFLGTLGVLLFMVFWMIAALAGYLWVAFLATVVNAGISGFSRVKG